MKATLKPVIYIAALAAFGLCAYQTKAIIDSPDDPIYKNIDPSVKPGEDFFSYANGTWLKNNPIPPAYSSWGIGNVVTEEIRDRLKKVNEDALKANAAKGTSTQKIGDFYYSGLDTTGIEKAGISPLQAQLSLIDKIQSADDILNAAAILTTTGTRNILGMRVGQDDKNSSKMMVQLGQTGLGLPNRDYYYKTDARTTRIRTDYTDKYLPTMLKLSGWDEQKAIAGAKSTYTIEKFLADSSRKLEDLRDPYHNYNKITIAQLNKLTPDINWTTLFKTLELKPVDSVIVGQPEYYRAVNKALKVFSADDWKAYLRLKLITSYAPYLSNAVADESFRFLGKVLRGQKEQLPRWKRVLDTENGIMGELLGQLFVKEYFPEKAKIRYMDEVEAIRQAYREHIQKLDWMSAETKQKALIKLNAIHPKVGYPDQWKDFSTLNISRESYAGNVIQARHWSYLVNINKLGKPINHQEWNMTPQTYNANYSPSNNEITLPAAQLLIPGIKDEDVDDAMAYGYVAASVIGHEITHGFDDEGRQYDAKGNLKTWWTPQDSVKFTQRAQMLVDQFNGYKVLDSLHVNGKATLGENIADLGGIVLGIDAFKKTKQYKEGKKINGFTPMQRFFLGYALSWLSHQRDEVLANQILTDVHAPAFLRVNGPFADIPEFYAAFGIKKGDKMWLDPDKRVRIW
ncbi:M13 family metallopeptidase [Mucilaginibacter sp. BJC16-A38]|uniref:M13 family metallopeptidase n=1 Tax=Mucilaginibacter phenanthrenivorans TaxID=1234842 RepID=UPI0021577B99|nr:M13 family metallopeptidase [Mucilaginibacter phenanthrenivorans]MCR8561479.1 M13 family metallopeptidase [Mucilaginibacter phenanthrenivorans]